MMKKSFVTGLVILLPLALTVAIVIFVFNLLTEPFLGVVKAFFDRSYLFQHHILSPYAEHLMTFLAQILILVSLFALTIGLGFIARWFFFRTFLRFAEYIVRHIPLVGSIYKTCKEVIKTIFTSKTNSFKQVVLVRFPNPETLSIGLVTRDSIPSLKNTPHADVVAVFVPTTPNPTSGFLIMYKEKELIYLDMTIEDAFKYVISCGVIQPPFNTVTKDEALQQQQLKAEGVEA